MGPCGHRRQERGLGIQRVQDPGMLKGLDFILYDRQLPKGFSAEKDKGISIWNLSKTVRGCGREIAFKISPFFLFFLKGLLASLLG